MTDIGSIRSASPSAVPPAGAAARGAAPAPAAGSADRSNDSVEVSQAARFLDKLANLPVRSDLIERVRQQISDGTYETSDKLSAALDSLSEDLAG